MMNKMLKFIWVIALCTIVYLCGMSMAQAEQTTATAKNPIEHTDGSRLVDKHSFRDLLVTTESCDVISLYDRMGNLTAYVSQFYEQGEPCSYFVTSNKVNDSNGYYIEFAEGSFWEMVGAYEIPQNWEDYTLLYFGGIQYYFEVNDNIYFYNNGWTKLTDEQTEFLDNQSTGVYYASSEYLTEASMISNESGYLNYIKSLKSTQFDIYTMTSTKYAFGSAVTLSNHCAPTAGLNLFNYLKTIGGYTRIPTGNWQTLFQSIYGAFGTNNSTGTSDSNVRSGYQTLLRSYGYGNATATLYSSASWSTIKSAIDSNPVHLCLHFSNGTGHSVIGIGYATFSHSGGQTNKYYAIINGYTTGVRYIHCTRGISSINMIKVVVGTYTG